MKPHSTLTPSHGAPKLQTPNQQKATELVDTDEVNSGVTIDSDDGYVAVPTHGNNGHGGGAAAGEDDDAVSIDENGDCDESRLLGAKGVGPARTAVGGSVGGRISTKVIPEDGGGGRRRQETVMEM